MLLFLGGPVPDAIGFCLDSLREYLRRGRSSARLLVPTTTLAEHLRNTLAREGFVLHPSTVSTFGKFVSGIAPSLRPVTPGVLMLLARDAIGELELEDFATVRDTPGFRAAVTRALEELAASGAQPADVPHRDLRAIYTSVLDGLRQRGLCFRSSVLRAAAERVRDAGIAGPILVTGFHAFTPPETELLRSLAATVELTVTAPAESPELEPFATQTRQLAPADPPAKRELVVAPTLEAECAEVARRILQLRAEGRPWRDAIVVIRSEQPYAPTLRTTFSRYGIPSRFLFATRLSDEPVAGAACALIESALAGWPSAESVSALRMVGSPLETAPGADRWEHDVLSRVPALGLSELRLGTPHRCREFFDGLEEFTALLSAPARPAEWQRRFTELAALLQPLQVDDGVTHERALLWKRHGAALAQFTAALADTTAGLTASAITASEYFNALGAVLESTTVRLPDNRRDAVNVMDAVEARQWRAPFVFVCGMVERQFPLYHPEDAILNDSLRRQLAGSGFPLATSAERQAAERTLFSAVLAAATHSVALSYPELNDKGEQNLPSFLLEDARPYAGPWAAVPTQPRALRERSGEPPAGIRDPALLERVATQHGTLHATAIETFLQCPFQFFAGKTLRLRPPPCDPWDRFNPKVQGNIVHETLHSHYEQAEPVQRAFESAFSRHCQKEQIPPGYRTEAIRLDLLNSVEKFVERFDAVSAGKDLFEQRFEVALADDVRVSGRIDRLHVDNRGQALVLDYKYKSKSGMQAMPGDYQRGLLVQGGLYLLAARDLVAAEPVGMLYCGCKRSVEYFGWVLHPYWQQTKNSCSAAELQGVMKRSREKAIEVAYAIRGGEIAPRPAQEQRCDWCDHRTSCRVEVERRKRAVAAGEPETAWN
jgi:ATP-dependent helicase/DNAse subunit B